MKVDKVMDDRLTKLQWDYLEKNFKTSNTVQGRHSDETQNTERQEIIDRYDIGYSQKQTFLLDYADLDPVYRAQLSLGLPLSEQQENRAYKNLDIENEERLVRRMDLIKMLSDDQLVQLNSLTSEARQTIVARLVDGRILGVLDDVLNAAPKMTADRNPLEVHVPNRLVRRMVRNFRKADKNNLEGIRLAYSQDIDKLTMMVDEGLVPAKQLVVVGRELLKDLQRDYWAGHTSGKQKIEIARHLLKGTNVVRQTEVSDWHVLPKKVKAFIELDIPLTHEMMNGVYGEYRE